WVITGAGSSNKGGVTVDDNEIVLTGLDGTNPLAFLAALGVLETLTDQGVDARLRWHDQGVWQPVVLGLDSGIEALVEHCVRDARAKQNDLALALEYDGKQDLKPHPDTFRAYL